MQRPHAELHTAAKSQPPWGTTRDAMAMLEPIKVSLGSWWTWSGGAALGLSKSSSRRYTGNRWRLLPAVASERITADGAATTWRGGGRANAGLDRISSVGNAKSPLVQEMVRVGSREYLTINVLIDGQNRKVGFLHWFSLGTLWAEMTPRDTTKDRARRGRRILIRHAAGASVHPDCRSRRRGRHPGTLAPASSFLNPLEKFLPTATSSTSFPTSFPVFVY